MTELLTERLHLRLFTNDDFEAHAAISADPDVMRYIQPGPMSRVDAWWQMARYLGHWQLRGHGIWAVVERATGRLVGRLGFLEPEGGHGFEIGWALAREAWGMGYALEGARAALHHGFTVLDRPRAVALIHPENTRSIRVAEKLGGKPAPDTEISGTRLLVFAIDRAPFGRGAPPPAPPGAPRDASSVGAPS